MVFVSRADWGAGGLGSGHRVPHSQFVGLVAHHTVAVMPDYDRDGFLHGDLDDVKRYMRWLQHARPDLGDEVPYSFVVFEGSTADEVIVAEGRGFGVTGAHTKGYNSSRYGVAVAGNTSNRRVTPGMLEGYRWIGRKLSDPAGARPTIGHRDTGATECPGNDLYSKLDEIQPPFTADTADTSGGFLMALSDAKQQYLYDRILRIERALTPKGDTLGSYKDSEVPDDRRLGHMVARLDERLSDKTVRWIYQRLQRIEQALTSSESGSLGTFDDVEEGRTLRSQVLAELAEIKAAVVSEAT